MKNEKMLQMDDAAEYLGIKKSTLYKMTSNKIITHYKPNRNKVWFLIEDLDKYLMSSKKIQGSIDNGK